MLIEFSVSNYRSFREKQTLSMVAAPRLRKRENVFVPEVPGEKIPTLLKVAVIYGPNASGKSNLLRALDCVRGMFYREPSAEVKILPVKSFRFDKALADQPSIFELHFIAGGVRYQFDLAMTQERVITEKLTMFPKGRENLLYERQHTKEGDKYIFGSALEGGEELFSTWRKLTSPQVLFISQAVANSSEELTQLRIPYSWFRHSVFTVLHGMDNLSRLSQELVEEDSSHGLDIASFLRDVDVPVIDIRVESEKFSSGLGAALKNNLVTDSEYRSAKRKTTLVHRSALGEAELSYHEESEGTKNLIGFWLPWWTREMKTRSYDRCVLLVDELDSSLHPKIVEILVEKHINSNNPTQLIFTTHDTHLMDSGLLRRDQIWITERDMNGATVLRSVHDFIGREGEDIEKRYYEGRYRGLPLIKRK